MLTKKKRKKERMEDGSIYAEAICRFMNHAKGLRLEKTNLHEDRDLGIDIKGLIGGDLTTFQAKGRQSGNDIIFETNKFMPVFNNGMLTGVFNRRPGRDTFCTAKFYAVLPKDRSAIVIVKTEVVKTLNNRHEREWHMIEGFGPEGPDDELVFSWWKKAKNRDNFCLPLHKFSNGTMIQFKIDEGEDGVYGKLLYYTPPAVVEAEDTVIRIEPLEGEEILNEITWRPR